MLQKTSRDSNQELPTNIQLELFDMDDEPNLLYGFGTWNGLLKILTLLHY